MKTLSKTAFLFVVLICFSCKKETCSSCSLSTNAPGASQYYTYCGTESEINKEDVRIKNGCVDLEAQYPQYYFSCGCN